MAHKGVVGAVALGACAYAGMERFKDWSVEREREEREQMLRDRQDEYIRRLEESQRKKGNMSARQQLRGGLEELKAGMAFQSKVYERLEEILYGLVARVGEEGGGLRRYENLQQLNLPLMSYEYDRDDLMLAAAFALGDADIVQRVAQSFEKQKLGIGLKKFTAKSINHIIKVFRSFEGLDIDHKTLSLFISVGVYSSDFHEGAKPKLILLNDEYSYSDNLQHWGDQFGLHVMHESQLSRSELTRSQITRAMRKGRLSVNAMHNFDAFYRDDEGKSGVILSNFRCKFETMVDITEEDGDFYTSTKFDQIRLIGGNKHNHFRRRSNIDKIANAFAEKLAADIAKAAVQRLTRLVLFKRRDQLISHEHITIQAGNSSDLLRVLREIDTNMILTHNEKIASTLQMTLRNSVPLPDEAVVKEGESPSAHLDREIATFVASYIKLVDLSYCEVPLLSGKAPSYFVPEYNVQEEAQRDKDCVWKARPLMFHSTRRLQVKEERERLERSRDLVVPGEMYSYVLIVSSWVFSSWLSTVTTRKLLQYIYPMYPNLFLYAVSQAFALWVLHSLVEIFKRRIFGMSEDSSSWEVVSCCTGYIHRIVAVKLGKPTPYDQELARLKVLCKTQYREWKLRIAKKEFYDALKRKRITNRESVLLLTEFAENFYETDNEEIVEGFIPAKLSEAEEFLKLKVEEQASHTETTQLSPDEALKNYLAPDGESGNRSSIECLSDLSAQVQKCVQFSEGDRVVVAFDEENASMLTDIPNSTALCEINQTTGSVVFSTATLCFVHFDGTPATVPIPVPINLCSLLHETPDLPALEGSSATSDAAVFAEESVVEDASDDEDNDDGVSIREASPPAKKRARTVEEALVEGGWKFKRAKKHIKFSRRVKLSDGNKRKQNVTLSKTPSDWRAGRNALALLRRLDESMEELVAEEEEDDEGPRMTCSECRKGKPQSSFSKSQLRKKGDKMKCKLCVSNSN